MLAVAILGVATLDAGAPPGLLADGIATTMAPGVPQGTITLGTGRDASRLTGVATVFGPRQPIEAHLWREVPFGFTPVAVRLFRLDPLEGPLMVWSDLLPVTDEQAALDFTVAGQEPATYRLLAYHAMTEPMASIDLDVVGEASALPPPPPVPEGWRVVASDAGDLRMVLPPDVHASETSGAIFANQSPDADGGMLQVMAEGPHADHPQPAAGESLVAWLEERWLEGAKERGPTVIRSLRLPAGETIELITAIAPGTEHEWWINLYAIRTPDGVGFLVIDGPTSRWDRPDGATELIPQLVEFGPGSR